MSLAEYRSVGISNGIPKVLALLFKQKVSVSLTDIRTALGEESVKNALKKINDDDPENIMAIKAILVLYRQKSTLTGDLKRYYDFILGDGSKTIVSLYEDIVNAEKDGQWKDFIEIINGMMNKSSSPAAAPAASAAAPSVESVSLVSDAAAVAAPVLEPESSPSEGAATAASSLTADTTKSKSTVSLSLKARVPAKSLNVGYKIYIKDGALNKEKHNELKEQYNAYAKLLVIDIESCTEVIYPIAIDLAPESTNQDVLDYIVKVLTEATQKNLKCHTGSSLHVFTIRTWTDTPRLLYVNIAK